MLHSYPTRFFKRNEYGRGNERDEGQVVYEVERLVFYTSNRKTFLFVSRVITVESRTEIGNAVARRICGGRFCRTPPVTDQSIIMECTVNISEASQKTTKAIRLY